MKSLMIKSAKIIGSLLLAISAGLYIIGQFEWYFALISGGFLFLGSLNKSNKGESLFNAKNTKQFLYIYSLFAFSGLIVEIVRTWLDLWVYTSIYNETISVILFILLLYPVFFAFVFELFAYFKRKTKNLTWATIITLIIFIGWNEIANIFLPMWVINPEYNPIFIYSLSFVGYIAELLVSIGGGKIIKKVH